MGKMKLDTGRKRVDEGERTRREKGILLKGQREGGRWSRKERMEEEGKGRGCLERRIEEDNRGKAREECKRVRR